MYPVDESTAAAEAFFEDFTLEPVTAAQGPSEGQTLLSNNNSSSISYTYLDQSYQNQLNSNQYFSQGQNSLGLQGDSFGMQPGSPTASQLSSSLQQQKLNGSPLLQQTGLGMALGTASTGWSSAEADQGLRRVNTPSGPIDSFESVASSQASSSQYSLMSDQLNAQINSAFGQNIPLQSDLQSFAQLQAGPSTVLNNSSTFQPGFASSPQPISMPGRQGSIGVNNGFPLATSPSTSFINSPTAMSPLAQSVYSTSPHASAISHSLPVTQQMMLFYSQQSLANARANFRNLSLLSQSPTLQNSGISSPPIGDLGHYGQSLDASDNKSLNGKDAMFPPVDKKERNRLAAERCRRKKADLIQQLTIENQLLRQENGELIKINLVLEQKLDYLINILTSYGISIPK